MPGEVDPASVTFGVPRSWIVAQRVVAMRQAPSGYGPSTSATASQPGPCNAQGAARLCSNKVGLVRLVGYSLNAGLSGALLRIESSRHADSCSLGTCSSLHAACCAGGERSY